MNSDLRGVQKGDWIWTIDEGWVKVKSVLPHSTYPILTAGAVGYTVDGLRCVESCAPSAFIKPPECFNAQSEPCEFVKGQQVLVRDHPSGIQRKAYFSHVTARLFSCFVFGKSEWSSDGATTSWLYCEAVSADE